MTGAPKKATKMTVPTRERSGPSTPTDADSPPAASVPTDARGGGVGVMIGAIVVVGLPILAVVVVFLPLALAVIELKAFGTYRVGEFCVALGILEPLETIYTPFYPWLEPLLQ